MNHVKFPTQISVPMSDEDAEDGEDDTYDAGEDPDYKPNILMYESLKIRGVSETRAKQQPLLCTPVDCRQCRRVTNDPHVMCIRHIIQNSLPVCARKSRCDACVKMDSKFWVRYMKSYYNQCNNLRGKEFEAHLEIQSQHGIPLDHRIRRDGQAVFFTRQQAGVTDGVSQRSGGGRISVSRRSGDVTDGVSRRLVDGTDGVRRRLGDGTDGVSRQSDGDTDHKPIGCTDIVLM